MKLAILYLQANETRHSVGCGKPPRRKAKRPTSSFFFFFSRLSRFIAQEPGVRSNPYDSCRYGPSICRNCNARGDHALHCVARKQKSQPPIAFRHSGGPHCRSKHPARTGPCTQSIPLLQRGGSSPSSLVYIFPFGRCMSKGSRAQRPGAADACPTVFGLRRSRTHARFRAQKGPSCSARRRLRPGNTFTHRRRCCSVTGSPRETRSLWSSEKREGGSAADTRSNQGMLKWCLVFLPAHA